MLSDAGLLSAHRCRPFDETADGYVRGEGVGVVVLRRLEHAFNGHDRIYALLRGAAVRHDGGGQGGVAIPSEVGQRDLLRAAYSDARVEPSQVRKFLALLHVDSRGIFITLTHPPLSAPRALSLLTFSFSTLVS